VVSLSSIRSPFALTGITVIASSRARRIHPFVVEAAISEQEIGFEWVSFDAAEDALERVGFFLVVADVRECQRHWLAV
jgi:hypothetical protein